MIVATATIEDCRDGDIEKEKLECHPRHAQI